MNGAEHEIFLQCVPGLEGEVAREARAIGLGAGITVPGGVELSAPASGIRRANLLLRCAERVLLRIARFRALHPAQLDKRARKVDWAAWLPEGARVRIEATCRRSRIYHKRAAAERVEGALRAALGPAREEAPEFRLFVRIDDDLCSLSLDTSGELLHRRGWKLAVGKAPMRETVAAACLARLGFTGAESVVDPMCGAGTFVIEAAEVALGLAPGRLRGFAFEAMPGFDRAAWEAERTALIAAEPRGGHAFGSDRDAGAIGMACENAARAGVEAACTFTRAAVSALTPPAGPPGIVIVNPPYGKRIGARRQLFALHGALGAVLRERFAGWRIGLLSPDKGLAEATGLGLAPLGPPIGLGGLRLTLWSHVEAERAGAGEALSP